MGARLSADIGGTFTDLVLLDDDGQLHVQKTSSTPKDFKDGVLTGVTRILEEASGERGPGRAITLGEVDYFVHGATVVLNALIQRKLPKTAIITTRGFRDVLEIMRTNNPFMYDMKYVKPAPLIPRRLRFEVDERVRFDGTVVRDLDDASVCAAVDRIHDAGVDAVAVCLLHSYANSDHERRIRTIIAEMHPDIVVCLSSDVASEVREFERTSTACINAATTPIISSYLDRLTGELTERGLRRDLYVMQSNGGVITANAAREFPVRTVMSGPSGGVMGGLYLSKAIGRDNVVTIDMGGTSSDMGVIAEGRAITVDESDVHMWPILAPMIEILAIGAGGGSIAWLDEGGALRVGPQSAGAEPGPVCYGRGGEQPTVSDACLVLGRLDPDYFLGGEMSLDTAGARTAIKETIADPLGMTVEAAAEGIIKVVSTNMSKAMWSILVARGQDPRDFVLMAFGGAGGLVAGHLLRTGDVPRAVVPNNPGALSAIGMLATDFRYDASRTHVRALADADFPEIGRLMAGMEQDVRGRLIVEGMAEADCESRHGLDVRYIGQEYYLNVPIEAGTFDASRIQKDFSAIHEKLYGYATSEFPVEVVNLRVSAIGRMDRPALPEYAPRKGPDKPLEPSNRRGVWFEGEEIDTPIYFVESLRPGDVIAGPAVIEDPRATTVVLAGQQASVDKFRNLLIEERERA